MKSSVHVDKLLAFTVGTLFCLTIGCSKGPTGPKAPEGPKASAIAKVICDGKPVTVGILCLDSGKGYIASASAGKDGRFELKGANGAEIPAGSYKVGITPPPVPPPAPNATQMPGPPAIEGVPEKFYNPSS